jgi:hypothetical protein
VETTTSPLPRPTPAFTPEHTSPNENDEIAERGDAPGVAWPLWQRVAFRFFFVYLALQIEPWDWFRLIPGVSALLRPYDAAMDWAVRASNAHVFKLRETLVPVNGSGDTSYAWVRFLLVLSIAGVACLVWTAFDRRRPHYDRLLYWLRLVTRYYIAAAALSYGIIKLFVLQMSFPTTSQLATPLGDFLPMRFSWLFIGYSTPYETFSGAMETVAGLLLLYRRTITAGLFAATGAFLNVVMINLAYDVPVKLFASHLLFACVFLLALDSKRLVGFLFLNRPAPATAAYDPVYSRPWQRWTSIAAKVFILYQFLWSPLQSSWTRFWALKRPPAQGPFAAGVYDVRSYVVNRDTIPLTSTDSIRWHDVIIDSNAAGSVGSRDPVFWQRYRRGYFRYKVDTTSRTAAVWKTSTIPGDSTFLFTMRYEVPDSTSLRFIAPIRGDTVRVDLVRVPRHFQLTERQFHWLSEYNR